MIKNSFILNISLKNILKNYNFFKKRKKKLIVAPTIKANAYGLGSRKIFRFFCSNGIKHFFVATVEEGIELNNKNKSIKIYVLNGIQDYNLNLFTKYSLIPIINSKTELKIILESNLVFGLHVDTGINRLGIKYNDIPLETYKNKKIKIVISHLASADEKNNSYNTLQKNRFLKTKKRFKDNNIIFSLSNTNGVALSDSYLFDMIRPGIGLYGGNHKSKFLKKYLKPVVFVKGKIIQISEIDKNEFIGYNQTFKTKKKSLIAVIGIGYADGIPRLLSNKGYVYYKKSKFKIVGRISMDSFAINITNSKYKLKIAMYVDLINNKYTIEEFAEQCKTISNEFLTSIGPRVKRIYE